MLTRARSKPDTPAQLGPLPKDPVARERRLELFRQQYQATMKTYSKEHQWLHQLDEDDP